jgi:prostaglandin reductase 3
LRKVLQTEYPKGIDIVYESVGGKTFDICVDSLAVRGKLIVIGFVSGYSDGSGWKKSNEKDVGRPLSVKLLGKSTSVCGFFLFDYKEEIQKHYLKLLKLMDEG